MGDPFFWSRFGESTPAASAPSTAVLLLEAGARRGGAQGGQGCGARREGQGRSLRARLRRPGNEGAPGCPGARIRSGGGKVRIRAPVVFFLAPLFMFLHNFFE